MECLRRAMLDEQGVGGGDQKLKIAVKYLSMFTRQREVFEKIRDKNRDKDEPEHKVGKLEVLFPHYCPGCEDPDSQAEGGARGTRDAL
jgi:hypothetical protein